MNKTKRARRVGRPKLPKRNAKSRIVLVRVKNDDLKLFAKMAKEKNQTLSEWIRHTLQEVAQKRGRK